MKFSKNVSIPIFVLVVVLHGALFFSKNEKHEVVIPVEKQQIQKIDLSQITLKPEPEPEPVKEPEIEPEPKVEPEPIQEPKVEPEPVVEPKPTPKPIVKPKPKPKPKPKKKIQPKKKPKKKTKKVKTPVKKPSVQARPKLSATKVRRVKASYKASVKALIEARKYYPKQAKRLKQQGVVTVRFTILANGKITNIKVIGNAKYKRLNQGAIETLKKIGKFSPIPKELGMKRMELDVPIEYILR